MEKEQFFDSKMDLEKGNQKSQAPEDSEILKKQKNIYSNNYPSTTSRAYPGRGFYHSQ